MKELKMTEQTKPNGYITASTEITNAIAASFGQGASIDEVFAALKVQAEVMSVRLTQAVMHQQQVEAMQAQQVAEAAEAGQQELDIGEADDVH
jgi:hypothetical protein